MSRSTFQIVAILLLTTLLVASAETMCGLAFAPAQAPAAECHHGGVPLNPQPADSRCCVSGYHSALLNRSFSPRPALQALKLSDAILTLGNTGEGNALPSVSLRSSGPPLVLVLRI